MQYAVVAIDYFTKWVEAEVLASIMPAKIKEFVYKNIVCQYRVPYTFVQIMEASSTSMNSRSSGTTSRSRKSSCRSHGLKPMGMSKL